MDTTIEQLSISELAAKYRDGSLSPVRVTQRLLEVIGQRKDINAWATVSDELALSQARQSEARFRQGAPLGPMDGIPYGMKDVIYTKGVRTTMCSRIYQDFVPDYNAAVVDRLEQAGAVLLGKLNTHEFASAATCDRSIFGPIRNPFDPEMIPGGSSGGNAAALAVHACPASVGTDCSGSLRIPSAICGVVGMRPTFGLVSRYGVYPASDSVDCVGPMTRTVRDNAIMLTVMAGYDPRDPGSADVPRQDYTADIEKPLHDLTIGVPRVLYADSADRRIRDAVDSAINLLTDMGATLRQVPDPDPDRTYNQAFQVIRISEIYANNRKNLDQVPDLFFPETRKHMSSGKDCAAWEYVEAQKLARQFKDMVRRSMEDVDLWIMPTVPMLPSPINAREVEVNGKMYPLFLMFSLYTIYSTGLGFPSLSIPCGMTDNGFPIGLQLLGKEFDERLLYRIAYQLESVYSQTGLPVYAWR